MIMMNKSLIITSILILLAAFTGYWLWSKAPKSSIDENKAVSLIQETYPEYQAYPSDNLPPRSIRSMQDGNGWRIQFVQEGSGVPIISATCFHVSGTGTILNTGNYDRGRDGDKTSLSFENCQ